MISVATEVGIETLEQHTNTQNHESSFGCFDHTHHLKYIATSRKPLVLSITTMTQYLKNRRSTFSTAIYSRLRIKVNITTQLE